METETRPTKTELRPVKCGSGDGKETCTELCFVDRTVEKKQRV